MQISMKQSNGCPTSHDIEINFNSGARMQFTLSHTETAIEVYKAIVFAYENGEQDNANSNLLREVETLGKKARGRG